MVNSLKRVERHITIVITSANVSFVNHIVCAGVECMISEHDYIKWMACEMWWNEFTLQLKTFALNLFLNLFTHKI